MIEEQVARRAAAADAASQSRLAGAAESAANLDKQRPAEAPRKVDVGAVAAIGVAVTGAVSVITLMLGYLFGMKPWQYPRGPRGHHRRDLRAVDADRVAEDPPAHPRTHP
jgi:hypothetical protein